jgi:hypothetical protein
MISLQNSSKIITEVRPVNQHRLVLSGAINIQSDWFKSVREIFEAFNN